MTKVAVVQAATVLFDTPATMAKVREWVGRAAETGAQIVVFPEGFIGGYPKGLDMGSFVGGRTPAGRDDFLRYWNSSVRIDGPEMAEVADLATEFGITIVIGIIEREHGTRYCAVATVAPEQGMIAYHRKLMPTGHERLLWGMGDGSTMPVVETPHGVMGTVICWENHLPLLRHHMYEQGVQIWCAPTLDDRELWATSMRHIAYEGRVFVLSACQYIERADCPDDYDCVLGNEPDTVLMNGGSCIISPLGEVLAGPVYGEEALLTAEIDLDEIVRAKYDLDVVGHYSRPDIFQLYVNTRANPQTVTGPPRTVAPAADDQQDPTVTLP
ncbi:carbon-nitrogen hydrolase family protein [Gordonia aichiensis]|uniref:carbon-nitrogen hydrolase family protein n=1 Tax=Gordonia aichiensis TaxID=36820 RepID=UPI003264FAA0